MPEPFAPAHPHDFQPTPLSPHVRYMPHVPAHEGHLVTLHAPNHPAVYVTKKGGHYYRSYAKVHPHTGETHLVADVWPWDVAELLHADPPYRLTDPADDEAQGAGRKPAGSHGDAPTAEAPSPAAALESTVAEGTPPSPPAQDAPAPKAAKAAPAADAAS